jgi:hypothetical protein
MRLLLLFLLLFTISACSDPIPNAQSIVDRAIEASGGERYEQSSIKFDFRDRTYRIYRQEGNFQMRRITQDSLGTIIDLLDNEGFTRKINDEVVVVPDSMARKYSSSINSVFYFALLPYGLNDVAVNKEYLGKASLAETDYHKLRITFDEEGGGEDHQDIFIYWIHPETYFVDYLAYSYEVNGGGMRFREAYNPRVVDGIRLVDYINYKPVEKGSVELEEIDQVFADGKLVELSRIELENVEVVSGGE